MHLYSCFLLALTLPLTWSSDDKSCECVFPNQLWGSLFLRLGLDIPAHNRIGLYDFIVDFKAKRARFEPFWDEKDTWYYLDYENNTMFSYDGEPKKNANSSQVRCTRSHLPDMYKFPPCVPAGSKLQTSSTKHYSSQLDVYLYHKTDSTYIVKHNTNPCHPTEIQDYVTINSTYERIYRMYVTGYKLSQPKDLFPAYTFMCKPGNFPWI